MYKLIIEDDEGKTTVVPLIRDEITIGRKEGNTIRLTERNVSRKHARLLKQNGAILIEDLTSYNGIKVNGDKINGRAAIHEGDRVQIGDYQLALKMEKTADSSATMQTAVPLPVSSADDRTTPFSRENGAPKIPLGDLPTKQTTLSSLPTAPGDDQPARLVVVSSNFPGREFPIDKAAVVIGRTDENDVVINHRSISRHHAKIVREGGHFHILDLQSANGVRVNGEEYGKVELRRGDHIDLGHVRMRFIAPGEDFVFERDAQIVDVGHGGRSRIGILFAVVGALALMAVGAVWYVTNQTPTTASVSGATPASTTEAPDNPTETKIARLLLDADRASKAEDWEGAIAKCDDALRLDPQYELAKDKRTHAENEKKNRTAYRNFVASADQNQLDQAVVSFGEITPDSLYRPKGSERYNQVKKACIKTHLELAKRAKSNGRCEEARPHVEQVLTLDESNSEAQEIARSCNRIATAEPPVRAPVQRVQREPKEVKETPVHTSPSAEPVEEPKRVKVVTAPPPAPKPKAEEAVLSTDTPQPASGLQSAKILQESQDLYVHGQYQTAIEQAKRATKDQPGDAWRIIGASACYLKDRNLAIQAWNHLDHGPRRQFLRYVCSRNGITVP